jgi:hypothetical protein
MTDGYTVRMPTHCAGEILPSGWHDIGLERGLPDELIYVSWRRFKAVSRYPFELKR